MSWAVGYDSERDRDIGYGVPSICDHPGCQEEIDRGLAYVCCEQQPFGGEDGCGLFFCDSHRNYLGQCVRCEKGKEPFDPKPDTPEWIKWKLEHKSWKQWRKENPEKVELLTETLNLTPSD